MPKVSVPALPPARHVTIGDARIAYFTIGPENGRPLLLCHGLAASGLQFVADAEYFAAQGLRVIVPDLRGHGRSFSPDARDDSDFSISRLAADLLAVLDAEDIAAADWVGNSLGGILGLSLMATDGARLGRFVSFGTAFALDVPRQVVPLMEIGFRTVGRELNARIGARLTCRGDEARAVIYAMLKQIDIDAVIRIARHVRRYDFIDDAVAFGEPMLMIRGGRDRAVNRALPPTLAAMTGRDNFKLIDLPDAGHCANLDQPGTVRAAILAFLDR